MPIIYLLSFRYRKKKFSRARLQISALASRLSRVYVMYHNAAMIDGCINIARKRRFRSVKSAVRKKLKDTPPSRAKWRIIILGRAKRVIVPSHVAPSSPSATSSAGREPPLYHLTRPETSLLRRRIRAILCPSFFPSSFLFSPPTASHRSSPALHLRHYRRIHISPTVFPMYSSSCALLHSFSTSSLSLSLSMKSHETAYGRG